MIDACRSPHEALTFVNRIEDAKTERLLMDVAKVPRQSPCSETKSMREPGPFSPPIKGNDHVELSSSLAAFCPFVLVPVLRGVQRQFSQERADLAHFVFKIGGAPGESLVTLAGAIFIAPYFILSALGGQIADKFDKALVAQRRALAPREADDPAVILFTSGSEGAPKGVVRGRNVMLGYLKV